MNKRIYISEETISDTKQIYIPDLYHPKGKDYSIPTGGYWTTIPKLIEDNFYITSITELHGNTTRWKIIVNQFDALE